MNTRLIALPCIVLAFASCDKAKKLANKASSAVQQQISTGGKDGGKIDQELQKLVDQTPEGAVFRKDLPFPPRIEVRTTLRNEMSGRFHRSSAIGQSTEIVNGTRIHISILESTPSQVRYTLEQASFSIPTKDDSSGEQKPLANPLEQIAPSTKPVTFRRAGNAWKTDDSDGFRAATLAKQLTPVFDQVLTDNALVPRPLWFAKRRMKPGDELVVTGDSLAMVLAGKAKGTLTLKLESFAAVAGHPCGVFTVKGDYSRKQIADFEGNVTDEEVAIQSGKIWLSMIYPIVLREEFDTIQSFKSGGQGGLIGRGQGTVKVSVERAWKPL